MRKNVDPVWWCGKVINVDMHVAFGVLEVAEP